MSLINKLEKNLLSSKFRLLTSYMSKNINLKRITNPIITEYHKGYKQQTEKWIINPIEHIIEYLKTLNSSIKIADIGCGEARISKEFNNVTSLDLFPINELILKADLEVLPLNSLSQDVSIYCLSLLKEDIYKSLVESNRILKINGICLIVETKNRINIKEFENTITSFLGFKIIKKSLIEGYFSFYILKKINNVYKLNGTLKMNQFDYKKR